MITLPAAGLFAGLFAVTGCATQKALDKTQSGTRWNEKTQKDETLAGNPAYYGAVPFTFAFDVATAPLWVPFVLYFAYSMSQPPSPPPAAVPPSSAGHPSE